LGVCPHGIWQTVEHEAFVVAFRGGCCGSHAPRTRTYAGTQHTHTHAPHPPLPLCSNPKIDAAIVQVPGCLEALREMGWEADA
jgi:hypothetical protein